MSGKDTGVDNSRISIFAEAYISLVNRNVDKLEAAQERV